MESFLRAGRHDRLSQQPASAESSTAYRDDCFHPLHFLACLQDLHHLPDELCSVCRARACVTLGLQAHRQPFHLFQLLQCKYKEKRRWCAWYYWMLVQVLTMAGVALWHGKGVLSSVMLVKVEPDS